MAPATLKQRSTTNPGDVYMGKTFDVDPNLIDFGNNSRQMDKLNDPERVKRMIASLKRNGQLSEVEVRPSDKAGRFINNLGFTRVAAAKAIRNGDEKYGVKADPTFTLRIRVVNKPGKSDKPLDLQGFINSIAENRDRDDVTPLDQAHALSVLRNDFGVTDNDEAARALGCKTPWLVTLDRLNDLDPDIKELVRAGQLGAKIAADTVGFDKKRVKAIVEAVETAAKNAARDVRKAGKEPEPAQVTTAARKAGNKAVAAQVAAGGKTRKSKAGRKSGTAANDPTKGLRASLEIRAAFSDLFGMQGLPEAVNKFAMTMREYVNGAVDRKAMYLALFAACGVKTVKPVDVPAKGAPETPATKAPARETTTA